MTDTVFLASDLASKRREFIGAGRDGRALLRDTDGFPLAMLPLPTLEAITEVAAQALALLGAEAAIREQRVRPADLGPLAWLSALDHEDQDDFIAEFRDALALAFSTSDVESVEICLREWKRTAAALSDPTRRAILTQPGDDNYVAVDTTSTTQRAPRGSAEMRMASSRS